LPEEGSSPTTQAYKTDWNVHVADRRGVLAANSWMLEEERRFGADLEAYLGPGGHAGLQRAAEIIGLEFCGFDITRLPTDEVLTYEANPAMDYDINRADGLPYLEASFRRLQVAVDTMVADAASRPGPSAQKETE
jgi:hypothetical protein